MKLSLFAIFAFAALATSTPAHKSTLGDDLKELRALIPFNKITGLLLRYFEHDVEFQEFVQLLLSDAVNPGFLEIEAIPEVKVIIEYMHNHGSDIYELLNKLHRALRLPPYHEVNLPTFKETGGLKGFFAELKSLLPIKQILVLYDHKLKTSPAFQEFHQFLQSPSSQAAIDKILANEHIINLIRFLKNKNVDLKVIAYYVTALVGIQFKPIDNFALRSKKPEKIDMTSHVLEFLSLVSTTKVVSCGNLYLKSSQDFRIAYLYLTSKMFQSSVKTVCKTAEAKQLVKYFETTGLSVKKYVKKAEAQFGYKKYNAQNADPNLPPKTGNMSVFVEDIKGLVSREEILQLAANKTATVPNYSNFTMALQSTELFELYVSLASTKEAKDLVVETKSFGIDLEVFAELAYYLIGLELKTSDTSSS